MIGATSAQEGCAGTAGAPHPAVERLARTPAPTAKKQRIDRILIQPPPWWSVPPCGPRNRRGSIAGAARPFSQAAIEDPPLHQLDVSLGERAIRRMRGRPRARNELTRVDPAGS